MFVFCLLICCILLGSLYNDVGDKWLMVFLVKFVFLVVIVCVGVYFYCVNFEWM